MKKILNVLVLEKRGCNFWKDDEEMNKFSDVGNYRVFFKGLKVKSKIFFGDISNGYEYQNFKPIHHHKMSITTYMINPSSVNLYIENPQEYGNIELEKKAKPYFYTQKDILEYVNSVNDFKIDKICIFDRFYNKIEEIAGYREKIILNICNKIQLIMDTPEHKVFRLWAPATAHTEKSYFDYDYISNTIVG